MCRRLRTDAALGELEASLHLAPLRGVLHEVTRSGAAIARGKWFL